jgi:hypothetical protein
VNVIFDDADLQCSHAMGARDTADKFPNTLFNVRHEPGLTAFG